MPLIVGNVGVLRHPANMSVGLQTLVVQQAHLTIDPSVQPILRILEYISAKPGVPKCVETQFLVKGSLNSTGDNETKKTTERSHVT